MTVTIDGKSAFPKKYLKAADLEGKDVPLTIASVTREPLRDPKTGEDKDKYVIRFVELADRENSDRPHLFVCNETNAGLIALATRESEMLHWEGKRIALYPTTVQAFGKMVDAIRVRDKAPARKTSGKVREEREPEPDYDDEPGAMDDPGPFEDALA